MIATRDEVLFSEDERLWGQYTLPEEAPTFSELTSAGDTLILYDDQEGSLSTRDGNHWTMESGSVHTVTWDGTRFLMARDGEGSWRR